MSLDHWPRVKALFEEAQQCAPDERAAWLDAACAGDRALRAEVERLLASDDGADAYFDTLGHAIHGEEAPGLSLPETVGPWRVTRELGHGGMGQVLEAERADGLYAQRVALKLVRPGLAPDLVARFRAERRMLAALEHPGIARLLDGGVAADGRPYFAMEFVEGEPLFAYADAARLGVEERLRVFLAVCDAVAYAHRQLIIHRDLKPNNILVTPDGTPKLLDFGIAKLLDEEGEGLTQTGLRLMTPDYAAPEQVAGGPIATTTDVYALGLLLFELLTGHRPYAAAERHPQAMAEAILEREPGRPSSVVLRSAERRSVRGETETHPAAEVAERRATSPERLRRRLAGDLDTICLKALRKEPERRYASVEALADDVRRHLGGLPVKAQPDTVGYRARKFVRRHRTGVGVVVFAFITLAAALGVSLWQTRVADRERDRAVRATEMLVEVLGEVDPNESGGQQVSARDLLDRVAARVERELGEDPVTRAAIETSLGQVYVNLGLFEPAERLLESALITRLRVLGPNHPDVQASRTTLGALLTAQSRHSEGDRLLREALGTRLARFGEHDPSVAASRYELGVSLTTQGRFEEAEPLLRAALRTRRRDDPDRARTYAALGQMLRRQGRLDEAEAAYRAAADGFRTYYGPHHALLGSAINEIGVTLKNKGEYEAAQPYYEEALAIFRDTYGERHPETAYALANLGLLYKDRGLVQRDSALFDRAEPLLERSLAIERELHAGPHLFVGHSEAHLGMLALARGDGRGAERWLRQALATHDAAQTDSLNTARPYPLTGLGEALMLQGRYAEAEALLREALHIREVATPGHWRIAEAKSALAECLTHLGRLAEARSLLNESKALIDTGAGEARRLALVTDARERELSRREAAGHRPGALASE